MARKSMRATRRKRKDERKNLKLWAEGVRETILHPHVESYADALERGWRAERECLQGICNEYHAKVSWKLADHEEPPLPLQDYVPETYVDVEPEDEDERVAKRSRIKELDLVCLC